MPKTCVAVLSRAICGGVTFFEFLILFFFFRNFKANMKKKSFAYNKSFISGISMDNHSEGRVGLD